MDAIRQTVRKYWGYDSFRPLQLEAMAAAVEGRDSLTVLPTGGGKSLCYQAPAVVSDRLTVVVSPLIALMKDQVDQLIARGIPAAFLNSSLEPADRRRVVAGIQDREYAMVFVAPERFQDSHFCDLLQEADVASFAIDEAHCISHWGHDFRVDYRQMGRLKSQFPNASVHAFTATATPRVREDIVAQLNLDDPQVLVGDFFRPNLSYRVERRTRAADDVLGIIADRPGQAGIVYCIRRTDVEELTATLEAKGVRARGYHAGMSDAQRTATQDGFAIGEIDIVVATVAFGMGIDRSDIRFVIHAAMPKTIEHYQQETGRAGRDGEPADCILFYSGADFRLWKNIIEKEAGPNSEDQVALLSEMYQYCTGARCRHERLVTYFGQGWDRESCSACDICNGTSTSLADATVTAQKILSCVVRTGQRYGAAYVADILRGEATDRAIERGHTELSTFALLSDQTKPTLMAWIDQLADQDLLRRDGEYRVLKVTPAGKRLLKDEAEARLFEVGGRSKPKRSRKGKATRQSGAGKTSSRDAWQTVKPKAAAEPLDAEGKALFEQLRSLRRDIAGEANVPAFMVCSDRTLREMARRRPTCEEDMLTVAGIGPAKFGSFGQQFIDAIRAFGG